MGKHDTASLKSGKIQQKLLAWGKNNGRKYPWRRQIPLWKGLLVEMMLQRTAADQVVQSFNVLDRKYPTAQSLCGITSADVEPLFAHLGLRWRIPLFVELATIITNKRGRLPRSIDRLMKLPGVGPYVSAAALSMYADVRAVIIDANTVRIASRIVGVDFDAETRRRRWVREILEELTPDKNFRKFNFAILDLGGKICTHKNPACGACPIQTLCSTGIAGASTLGAGV